jgi:hypothetical protein
MAPAKQRDGAGERELASPVATGFDSDEAL